MPSALRRKCPPSDLTPAYSKATACVSAEPPPILGTLILGTGFFGVSYTMYIYIIYNILEQILRNPEIDEIALVIV